MTRFVTGALAPVILPVLASFFAAPATAAPPQRVWVSHAGVDNGTCGATATPCATFQAAHDNVAAGGIVGVLDPGDYGAVTITKSVSITNDGSGEAGILSTAQFPAAAITINAGPGDIVGLRGLVVDGADAGTIGINVQAVNALHIQNCAIRNFEGGSINGGIVMVKNNSGVSKLFISDTLIYNNGGSNPNSAGVTIASQAGAIDAVLNRVRIENNVNGLAVFNDGSRVSHVIVRDSFATGNASDGIRVVGHIAVLVKRTTATNNAAAGLHADGTHAVILVSGSKISDNGSGVSATNGGQVISYGNNRNNSNIGAEGTATSTFGLF